MLSDDFEVVIHKYHYKDYELKGPYLTFILLAKIGNLSGYFSEELEIIIKVNKGKGWKRDLPQY